MTDIIQEQGGFVDKYIGDAIVGVFGAPLDDPSHAENAVSAALRCRDRLHKLNREPTEWQRFTLHQAHRAQFRRRAGRQYRFAPALQLYGDGRHRERGVAARGRQ